MNEGSPLLLTIDTASDVAGASLSQPGRLLAECTWHARQTHSRQLLPTVDWLLTRCELDKSGIEAVCVCLGPGSYAGLRVGTSTAKALAFALAIPLVGLGRLAADAYPVAVARGGRVFAVHAAGRAELAWGCYMLAEGALQELVPPRLAPATALASAIAPGDAVVVERLGAAWQAQLAHAGAVLVEASPVRTTSLAALGHARLARGERDDPDSLVPLYLRAPAIGPQS